MRLLLDTHVMLWFAAGDERVAPATRDLIVDERNEVAVSVVSVWEAAIKARLGLGRGEPMGVDAAGYLRLIEEACFTVLSVLPRHALAVQDLPALHGDPFDRLLVATAVADTWRLVSADRALFAYGDVVLPA